MPFKELCSDKLHLGTSKAVFMEPRDGDVNRYNTKSNFKGQSAQVMNREQ